MRKGLVIWGLVLIAVGIGVSFVRIPIGVWDGEFSSGYIYTELWPLGVVFGAVGVVVIVRGMRRHRAG